MDKEILNTLKPGEKAVDIQEYYWGENGHLLVYKVTIYKCKKRAIFFKHIEEFTYPFYFASKKFAEEFIQNHEKFQIWAKEDEYNKTHYYMTVKDYNSKSHKFYMIDTRYSHGGIFVQLQKGYIWNGTVNKKEFSQNYNIDIDYNLYYLDILEHEKAAAKEGTTGKTFSYKLSEV